MKICGVELIDNDAVVCLLQLKDQLFSISDCRVRKLSIPRIHTRQDLQEFQATFSKLMADYGINKIAIKENMSKGKFAASANSFKLESAIQLIPDIDVVMFSPEEIKTALSNNPLPIAFESSELKVFQKTAFNVAYAAHRLK